MKRTKEDYVVGGLLIFAVLIGGVGIIGVFIAETFPHVING